MMNIIFTIFLGGYILLCQEVKEINLTDKNFVESGNKYIYYTFSPSSGKWKIHFSTDVNYQIYTVSKNKAFIKVGNFYSPNQDIKPSFTILFEGNSISENIECKISNLLTNNLNCIVKFNTPGLHKIKYKIKNSSLLMEREIEKNIYISTNTTLKSPINSKSIEFFHNNLDFIINGLKNSAVEEVEKYNDLINILVMVDKSGSMEATFNNSERKKIEVVMDNFKFIFEQIQKLSKKLKKDVSVSFFFYGFSGGVGDVAKMMEWENIKDININEIEKLTEKYPIETTEGKDAFRIINNLFAGKENLKNYVIFITDAQDTEFFSLFYSPYENTTDDRFSGDTEESIAKMLNIKYYVISVEQDNPDFNNIGYNTNGDAYVNKGSAIELENYLSKIIMEMIGSELIASGNIKANEPVTFMVDKGAELIEIILTKN